MTLEPSVAGPQAEPAVVPEPAPERAPRVLDNAQRALLRAVLNRIVPPHGVLAGAGDLDVGSSIERTLAAAPGLRRLFLEGLFLIELTAHQQAESDFVDLDPTRQTEVLEFVEQRAPACFVALVEHAYRGYYTLPAVQNALGARAPQPLGHTLPVFDPALLERQRERAPFWRPAS